MSEQDTMRPLGPFALSGVAPRPDPATVPIRGDLAHIALAGRYFVPHYARPRAYRIIADTPLRAAAASDSDSRAQLAAGSQFDVLDCEGAWAWGCVGEEGPVGWVALDAVEPAA